MSIISISQMRKQRLEILGNSPKLVMELASNPDVIDLPWVTCDMDTDFRLVKELAIAEGFAIAKPWHR